MSGDWRNVASRVARLDDAWDNEPKMVDISKQVAFWADGAREDWAVAQELMERGRTRHALFPGHLALEKALKARVCSATQELAPRIHNLARLAEVAGLALSQDQLNILAEMNAFNIEGRYPDLTPAPPTVPEAKAYMSRSQEVIEWLIHGL